MGASPPFEIITENSFAHNGFLASILGKSVPTDLGAIQRLGYLFVRSNRLFQHEVREGEYLDLEPR